MSGLYQQLYAAFQKRYNSESSKKVIQFNCNETWKDLKSKHKDASDLKKYTEQKIKSLHLETTRRSEKLLNYFTTVSINNLHYFF